MSWITGYHNEFVMNKNGLHGKNRTGYWWEYDGTRYYFEDENKRRWFARHLIQKEEQTVIPIKTEKAKGYSWETTQKRN